MAEVLASFLPLGLTGGKSSADDEKKQVGIGITRR